MSKSLKRLHVLQIIKGLDIGNIHGGAERFALELAIELAQNGVDVSVCAFFITKSIAEEKWKARLRDHGIPCIFATPWMGNNNFRSYIQGIINVETELKRRRVDICHSHFQLGTVCSLWLKIKRKTYTSIRTQHVSSEWEPGWYGALRHNVFSKWIFPIMLDAEIGVSQSITQSLNHHPGTKFSKRPPVCIHNAISSYENLSTENRKDANSIVIGTVGRLTEVKNYDVLITAFSQVKATLPNAVLWFIGDGEEREHLESIVSDLGMRDVVRFWGNQDDVRTWISQMDLFVLPSKREGFPSAILESLSMGIPVVGTDVTGIRELIVDGKTGWMVKHLSATGLAETILTAINDTDVREAITHAGLDLVKNFSMQKIAGEYLDLYREISHQGL